MPVPENTMPTAPTRSDPTRPDQERRDYFRIRDRIGLEIRRLEADTSRDGDIFDDEHLTPLRAELLRLDHEIRKQLASLAERDRELTTVIKALNGKLDILARIIAFEQNPLQPDAWQEVTLSEGGLSFSAPAGDWHPGDRFVVRMTLAPELLRPVAEARVFECSPQSPESVRVHTEFVRLSDNDRQQIARHVMRWQIRQRQKG